MSWDGKGASTQKGLLQLGRINVHMQVAYQHSLHHITRSESSYFEQNQGSPVRCSCFRKNHHIWLQSLYMAFRLINPNIQLKRNQMQIGAEGIEHLFLTSSFVTMMLQKKAVLKKTDSKRHLSIPHVSRHASHVVGSLVVEFSFLVTVPLFRAFIILI